mgnify:CR=1 FL=1
MNLEKIIIISPDKVKLIDEEDEEDEEELDCSCELFTCLVWIFWFIVVFILYKIFNIG